MREETILELLGREKRLFVEDEGEHLQILQNKISSSTFLIIGGAGSIGSSTVMELLRYGPAVLHVVDLDENALVELSRAVHSTYGQVNCDFRTVCVDAGSDLFLKFLEENGPYDYVLNFSALKHVRSEKDPFTLMRMIEVNIINNVKILRKLEEWGQQSLQKYFAVSTDKAANPVNMMGASKRIMEFFLLMYSEQVPVTTARFANVAFSKGSLLEGFLYRLRKKQPIAAPSDVRRYFITPQESGKLCTLATILGGNRELFFPKLGEEHALSFDQLAVRFLRMYGYEPYLCDSEEQARALAPHLPDNGKWPCYFFASDTTGEKELEEFFTADEEVDLTRFRDLGIVKLEFQFEIDRLNFFLKRVEHLKRTGWSKSDLVELFKFVVPNFEHRETGKYLDQRM